MRDKHDYMQKFGVENEADILRTLAMFGGFTEGLQLFASFAMLMNFPRFNKMKGMGQIVTWSVRDESLHCEGIIRLFHAFAAETGALTKRVRDDIVECARTVVRLEDRFIDLAFEIGPDRRARRPSDIKNYIRYIADWRLQQLGLPNALRRQGAPAAVAHGDPERRRARQLLRDARHGILEGRDRRRLARRRRRVGAVRPAHRASRAAGPDRRAPTRSARRTRRALGLLHPRIDRRVGALVERAAGQRRSASRYSRVCAAATCVSSAAWLCQCSTTVK